MAMAESLNGEVTCSPLEGLFTVTLAMAGTFKIEKKHNRTDKSQKLFMGIPFSLQADVFERASALASVGSQRQLEL